MGLIGAMGAGKAAEQQAKIAKQIAGGWKQLGQTEFSWFQPFMQAGTQSLSGQMQMLANPVNSQEALATYYSSPEYAMQEQQAQYAAESAAEPYGGMGGSATSNYLGNQAVQLGQNYLKSSSQARQQQFNNMGSISKMGLNASTSMGNLATQDMRGVAEAMGMAANAQGQEKMAPYTGWSQFAATNLYGLGMMASHGAFGAI